MSEQKDGFIKMFSLYQFRVFHPDSKEHLSGAEWMALIYILERRLLYIRFDPKAVNGNTVHIDRAFKLRMFEDLSIKEKTYEAMITKLVHGGIFYRLARGWFMVNPYVFCKGTHVEIVRNLGVFRKSTLAIPLTQKKMPQFLSTPTYRELVEKITNQNQEYRQKENVKIMETEEIQELKKEEDFFFTATHPDVFSARKDIEPFPMQNRTITRFFTRTDGDGKKGF